MDPERNHEAAPSEVREFLDNVKDFWGRYGTGLVWVGILVLGGFALFNGYNKWQANKAEAAYTELNSADSADAFRTVAGEHSKVHDEAMRRAGDTSLSEARGALVSGEAEAAASALNAAGDAYTALADRGATVEYRLVGQVGLAKVALMQEEWDVAAGHYEKVIELAGDAFPAQAERAQQALDRMDLLKNPVAFAPPEAEPAVEPAPAEDAEGEPAPAPPPLPMPMPEGE